MKAHSPGDVQISMTNQSGVLPPPDPRQQNTQQAGHHLPPPYLATASNASYPQPLAPNAPYPQPVGSNAPYPQPVPYPQPTAPNAGPAQKVTNVGHPQFVMQQAPNSQVMARTPEAYVVDHNGKPVTYNDQMVIAIISCLFCCILGIFAIIKAKDAKQSYRRGDYVTAVQLAQTAKRFAIAGIFCGIILSVLSAVSRATYAANYAE